jgi:hypothetical protein
MVFANYSTYPIGIAIWSMIAQFMVQFNIYLPVELENVDMVDCR